MLQVFENVRNHCRILNAGDHFDLVATTFTNFHVNIEHPFEPLHPCHRPMTLLRALVEPIVIGWFRLLWLLVLATFGGYRSFPNVIDFMFARAIASGFQRIGFSRL